MKPTPPTDPRIRAFAEQLAELVARQVVDGVCTETKEQEPAQHRKEEGDAP